MQTVEISKIEIDQRQRKIFIPAKVEELAESIITNSLLHPIVLKPLESGNYRLLAGERRLRAMQLLHLKDRAVMHDGQLIPKQHIPFTAITSDDPFQLKEIELHENIMREDLTWQERNEAIAALYAMRKEQHPEKSAVEVRAETAQEIAQHTGQGKDYANFSIKRAELLQEFKDDPEVQRAGSQREAFKIVSRKLEEEFIANTERQRVGRGTYACMQGDLREMMPTLKPNWFQVIIADPPYGMGADEFGDAAQNIHAYEDTPEEALTLSRMIFEQGYRVATATAHLFLFCDIDRFTQLRDMSKHFGWTPWRTPLIWSKGGMGHAPDPQRGPKRVYESILFCRKGDIRIKAAFPDVLTYPPERERMHAAQKPAALYAHLAGWSVVHGCNLLDPCCGSGTIFPAAKMVECKALGIEKDERFFNHAAGVARSMV